MKAIWFDGTKAEYRTDIQKPVPGERESLIQILLADICSTDKEILKGYRPDFCGIMGHEFVGTVLESDDEALRGKLVVGELNEGCGTCLYCRTGREKHCLSRRVLGMSRNGCFAEYMTLSTHLLHPVPEGLPPEKAIFTEPLAAALEILKQVHADPAANAAVIGDGRLAFMIAQVLSLTGMDLTVIGKHEHKLAAFSGFAKTAPLQAYRVKEGFRPLSAEEGFEIVVDASGNESGLALALSLVRKMGTIVLKSTYAGSTAVDMSLFAVNELTLVGSRCGPFAPALKLLKDGRVTFPPVELYDLSEFEKAFASDAFKAGFAIS